MQTFGSAIDRWNGRRPVWAPCFPFCWSWDVMRSLETIGNLSENPIWQAGIWSFAHQSYQPCQIRLPVSWPFQLGWQISVVISKAMGGGFLNLLAHRNLVWSFPKVDLTQGILATLKMVLIQFVCTALAFVTYCVTWRAYLAPTSLRSITHGALQSWTFHVKTSNDFQMIQWLSSFQPSELLPMSAAILLP